MGEGVEDMARAEDLEPTSPEEKNKKIMSLTKKTLSTPAGSINKKILGILEGFLVHKTHIHYTLTSRSKI